MSWSNIYCIADAVVEETESIKKAKALEVRGVRAAEAGNVEEALSCFSQAVVESPTWPSAYNNRAQALRLQGDEEGTKYNTLILDTRPPYLTTIEIFCGVLFCLASYVS